MIIAYVSSFLIALGIVELLGGLYFDNTGYIGWGLFGIFVGLLYGVMFVVKRAP